MNVKLHKPIILKSVLSALVMAFLWSVFIETGLLTQRDLVKSGWESGNIRIAFLSDLHAGAPHINKNYILHLVSRINAMNPDLVLIGGDLVINGVIAGTPMPIEEVAELLNHLKAPLGRFVTLGNHDWWNNGEHIKKVLNEVGFMTLENQSQLIQLSNNSKFWLIGIGDHYTEHADPARAFANTTDQFQKIVFMHDPGALLETKDKFFLAFAGHMHGGQVYIPGIGAVLTPGVAPKDWAKGWVDFKLGSLYVSQGIGTSILPVRFNAPPEFVILDLKK